MCGICGFNWKDEQLWKEMGRRIKHRGPDDIGFHADSLATIGQLRLSIIDLSPAGHQPMYYSKKRGACSQRFHPDEIKSADCAVVFNGEIYNYQEIKPELEKKGYVFSTKSDTEVILAAYQEWGFGCVNKFNGMWALAIYDFRKKILFCSRDRLGVKPFYYYHKGGKFIFASEIKSILAHGDLGINRRENININALRLYFGLGFVPSPLSIYNDVFKLPASHSLVFDLKSRKIKKLWQYYELPKYKPVNDRKKLIAEGRELLFDATRLRLIADVPVGAFLSGGLDSSAVVGAMSKFVNLRNLNTFSIGFEGKYDESKYIKVVKDHFRTRHHHYYFRQQDFEKLISKFSEVYDEPFWDYSGFPTYKVSEIARKQVTVALSGDGGDEIFGGYLLHKTGSQMDIVRKMPKVIKWLGSMMPAKKNLNSFMSPYLLKQAFRLSLEDPKYFYAMSLEEDGIKPEGYAKWTADKLAISLRKGGNRLGEAIRIYDLLYGTLQDNFLVKVDRASMAHALEVRSPFLDYRFAEFSQKIPTKWKQNSFRTKILMREIIKGLVPDEIVRRGKQGFSPPVDKWILQEKYKPRLKEGMRILEALDPSIHRQYAERVFSGENNMLHTQYKIRLFLFHNWWKRWVR